MLITLYYFSHYLLTICIIWIIGGIILAPFSKRSEFQSLRFNFFRLLTGILFITFISGLYFTGGRSIFWLLGIIPIILLLQKKEKLKFQSLRDLKYWIPNLYTISLVPVAFVIQYFNFGPETSFIPFDIIDYVTVTEFNARYNKENIFGILNALPAVKVSSHSPYHYAELWFNHLFSQLYTINAGKNLLYITYASLLLAVLIGFISLFENILIKKYWLVLFVLAILFAGPVYWSGIPEWFGNVKYLGGSFIIFENFGFFGNTILTAYHAPKHLYFVTIFIALMLLKDNRLFSLTLISVLPVINIGLTIGVFSFGAAYFFYTLFNKSLRIKEILLLAIPSVLMLSIYVSSGLVPSDVSYPSVIYSGSEAISAKGEVLRGIMRITNTLLYIVIIFAPLLIIYILSRRKGNHRGFELPAFFAFTSLLLPVLSRPLLIGFDSAQFLTYMLPAFTTFILYVSLEFIVSSKRVYVERILTTIVLVCLITVNAFPILDTNRSKNKLYTDIYSETYIREVEQALNNKKAVKNIGYLLSDDILKANMPTNWKHQRVGSLAAENNHWGIISLNNPEITLDFKSWSNESFHNHQQFFWNSEHGLTFEDSHLIKFILDNSISHVFISSGLNPVWIEYFEASKITDKKTGESLVIIKGSKNERS